MYYSSNKKSNKVSPYRNSLVFWLVICMSTTFFVVSPFFKALFNGNSSVFDGPIFSSLIFGSMLLFILSIFMLFHYQTLNKSTIFSLIVIWLLPLSYYISTLNSVSYTFSSKMTYLYIFYAIFFLLGLLLAKEELGRNFIKYLILTVASVIIFYGFLNWFGFAHYQDALYGTGQESEVRLTSVFQYANSYASFLMAFSIGLIYLCVNTKKNLPFTIYSFLLVPSLLSFILTLSRGAYVIFPVIFIGVLFLISFQKQVKSVVILIISLTTSLVLFSTINNIGVQIYFKKINNSMSGLLMLILASLITMALLWVANRYLLQRLENLHVSSLIIPITIILLGVILVIMVNMKIGTTVLPVGLQNRIEAINLQENSLLERSTFYSDGIKIFYDHPLFGAGGGAWATLYEKYQNNPYTSRQAHNFFLQHLIETGIVGTLILLALLSFTIINFFRSYIKQTGNSVNDLFFFFIFSVTILIHSIIDFNMSYVFLATLVFLTLGTLASINETDPKTKVSISINKFKLGYCIFLGCISIFLLFTSIQLTKSNNLFKESIQLANSNQPLDRITNAIDRAIAIQTYNPEFIIFKSQLLNQVFEHTKQESYLKTMFLSIQNAKIKEPYSKSLLDLEYNYFIKVKDSVSALNNLKYQEVLFPWDIGVHERIIAVNTDLGNQAKSQGKREDYKKHWDEALKQYVIVLEKIKYLDQLPKGQEQGRPFHTTPTIAFSVGQIYFARGNYELSTKILQQGVNYEFPDELSRIIARWFLASLRKQGVNEPALYEKLIAKDPNEKNNIEALINASFD